MIKEKAGPNTSWRQFWTCWGVTCAAGLFVSYTATYAALSRRGMTESSQFGVRDGWFYVPLGELGGEDSVNGSVLNRHHALRIVFLPIHELDALVFDTPHPWRGGTWDLSQQGADAPTRLTRLG